MISQVVQYKNLEQKYKDMLKDELDADRYVYIVKDNNSNVKSLTTSVLASIQKLQAKK